MKRCQVPGYVIVLIVLILMKALTFLRLMFAQNLYFAQNCSERQK